MRGHFQYGIEGLNEAIDRFDPDYGTKFETRNPENTER
jgi:RNA polymerase sigma factor for flagellar operon FliA